MSLTADQLESILGYVLENCGSRPGFIRVNLEHIQQYRVKATPDGTDVVVTSFEEGRRVTDRFPVLPNMGS